MNAARVMTLVMAFPSAQTDSNMVSVFTTEALLIYFFTRHEVNGRAEKQLEEFHAVNFCLSLLFLKEQFTPKSKIYFIPLA